MAASQAGPVLLLAGTISLSPPLLVFFFFSLFSGAEGGTLSFTHVRQVPFSQVTPPALLPFPSDSSGKASAAFPKVVLQTPALSALKLPLVLKPRTVAYRPFGSNIRP